MMFNFRSKGPVYKIHPYGSAGFYVTYENNGWKLYLSYEDSYVGIKKYTCEWGTEEKAEWGIKKHMKQEEDKATAEEKRNQKIMDHRRKYPVRTVPPFKFK